MVLRATADTPSRMLKGEKQGNLHEPLPQRDLNRGRRRNHNLGLYIIYIYDSRH